MQDKKFNFWLQWLIVANVIIIIMGFMVAFFGDSFLFYFHNEATKEVFFEGNEIQGSTLHYKKFLYGIIGGTMVGFQVLMLFIVHYPFRKKEVWAYRALWAGLLSWFVIDTSLSTFHGAYHNVYLINLFALLLMGLPLVMTRKYFR